MCLIRNVSTTHIKAYDKANNFWPHQMEITEEFSPQAIAMTTPVVSLKGPIFHNSPFSFLSNYQPFTSVIFLSFSSNKLQKQEDTASSPCANLSHTNISLKYKHVILFFTILQFCFKEDTKTIGIIKHILFTLRQQLI